MRDKADDIIRLQNILIQIEGDELTSQMGSFDFEEFLNQVTDHVLVTSLITEYKRDPVSNLEIICDRVTSLLELEEDDVDVPVSFYIWVLHEVRESALRILAPLVNRAECKKAREIIRRWFAKNVSSSRAV